MAFNTKSLTNIITFRHDLLTLVSQLVDGGSSNTLLSDIKDSIDAIAPLIDGLELITGNIKIDTASVNLNIDQVEAMLNLLERRSRPLVWIETHVVEVGDNYNPGSFSLGANPARRAVRITNNSGDSLGRQAACAFVDFSGNLPDRTTFAQVCPPGQSILLDSPQSVVKVRFAGNGATVGTISIVEYQ